MADTDIKFRVSQTGAEKTAQDFKKVENSFDGVDITAQELHQRLADLNQVMVTSRRGTDSYNIAQRERSFALQKLISLEGGNAAATQKSTRGLSTLSSAMGRAVLNTGMFSGSLSVLTPALMGGAGLTAGLAVAVGAIQLISKELFSGGFAVDDYAKKIEELKDKAELFADANDKVTGTLKKMTDTQIVTRIQILRDELSNLWTHGLYAMGIGRRGFAEAQLMLKQLTEEQTRRSEGGGQSFAERIRTQIKEFTRLRDEVAQTKDEYDRYNSMVKMYNDLLKEQTNETKKVTKAVEEYAKVMDRVAAGQGATVASGAMRINRSFGIDATRKITGGGASGAMISKELQEQMSQTQDLIAVTAGVLREEFTQAWEDVFGEANSLFEKFAMRIAEYFTELALRQAAMGLFNLIFPGAGSIVGAAAGAAGASPAGNRSINIILDGEKVGSFVDRRVPYSVNRATRLDIL